MKPLVYLQILDSSLRYLAVHPRNHGILDREELVFDLEILSDRQITNVALLQSRLDALVREKKWRQAKAYVLLINDFVVIKEESVPAQLNEDEVRDYLRLQMNDAIRIPFENPVFDYDLLERDEEEQKLVLVAYPGDSIEDYKKILQGARLRPEVADVASLSLYRLAGRQGLISSEAGEHNLILQLEPYSMNMTMFHRDQPTFSRDSYS
ncbi:MAG: pilus assembly protein PilM [Eubacteriales bacterium]|nr:pilus assembly protein PilM [Eubacteriales bacterium]